MTHHGNIVTFVRYLIWTKNTYTSDITCEVVKTLSAVFKASPLEWRLTGCSFMVSCCLFFLLWKTEDIFKKDDCVFSNNSIRMRTNSIKRRTGGERTYWHFMIKKLNLLQSFVKRLHSFKICTSLCCDPQIMSRSKDFTSYIQYVLILN